MLARTKAALTRETLVRMNEGHKLPLKPSAAVLRMWCEFGRRNAATRKIIRLESVKIGGARYTSIEAYDRWIEALNEGDE